MLTTEEYRLLWNAISETMQQLDNIKNRLIQAQQQAEELIISKEES